MWSKCFHKSFTDQQPHQVAEQQQVGRHFENPLHAIFRKLNEFYRVWCCKCFRLYEFLWLSTPVRQHTTSSDCYLWTNSPPHKGLGLTVPASTTKLSDFTHFISTRLWRWNRHNVPNCQLLNTTHRGQPKRLHTTFRTWWKLDIKYFLVFLTSNLVLHNICFSGNDILVFSSLSLLFQVFDSCSFCANW
jgi:hypothetical protein